MRRRTAKYGAVRVLLWTVLIAFAGVAGYYRGVADSTTLEATGTYVPAPKLPEGTLSVRTEDESNAEAFERLSSIGYLPGYEPATANAGVLQYDEENAQPGLNLFTSGHAPAALLMDLEGQVVYEWSFPFEGLWPDAELRHRFHEYWRRAHVFPNGDLLAVFETHGMIRVNAESELLWAKRNQAHHDFFVDDRGHIFALTRDTVTVERDEMSRPVFEEYVVELGADGEELSRVSILEAVKRSVYRPALEVRPWFWDMLHTNSIVPLLEGPLPNHPAFQPGNYLLSIRELNAVAVLNPETERIEWALQGPWYRQHEASLVGPGNVLVFDNRGYNDRSRVVEIDPLTHEIIWEYGLEEEEPLFSATSAAAARLDNGNTLIVESNAGRVFEVTPDKEIVWEFVNPHTTDGDRNLTAAVLSFERLPESFTPEWLGDDPRERLAHAR